MADKTRIKVDDALSTVRAALAVGQVNQELDGYMFFSMINGQHTVKVNMTEAQIVSVIAKACESDLDLYQAILRGCIRGGSRRGMRAGRYIRAK